VRFRFAENSFSVIGLVPANVRAWSSVGSPISLQFLTFTPTEGRAAAEYSLAKQTNRCLQRASCCRPTTRHWELYGTACCLTQKLVGMRTRGGRRTRNRSLTVAGSTAETRLRRRPLSFGRGRTNGSRRTIPSTHLLIQSQLIPPRPFGTPPRHLVPASEADPYSLIVGPS
jgi:hypothetical protein